MQVALSIFFFKSGSHVVHASLELLITLLPPPKCCYCRRLPPRLVPSFLIYKLCPVLKSWVDAQGGAEGGVTT